MDERTQDRPDHRRFGIWVEGRLGEDLASDIGATAADYVDGVTCLSGALVDQSQIYGILDRLRQLGIDVMRFDTNAPAQPDAQEES